jgi:hypothetical protein
MNQAEEKAPALTETVGLSFSREDVSSGARQSPQALF